MTGQELRTLRSKLNRSLAELAEETGVTVSTICRYQNGKRPIPEPFARLVMTLRKRQRKS